MIKNSKRILFLLLLFILTSMTAYAETGISFRYGKVPTLVISIIVALISGMSIIVAIANHKEVNERTIGTLFLSVLIIILAFTMGLSSSDEANLERIEKEMRSSEERIKQLEKDIDKPSNMYRLEELIDEYHKEVAKYNEKVNEYNSILE